MTLLKIPHLFHGCFVYTLALCFLYDLIPLSFTLMEWYV